jgi:hypothetical protein
MTEYSWDVVTPLIAPLGDERRAVYFFEPEPERSVTNVYAEDVTILPNGELIFTSSGGAVIGFAPKQWISFYRHLLDEDVTISFPTGDIRAPEDDLILEKLALRATMPEHQEMVRQYFERRRSK